MYLFVLDKKPVPVKTGTGAAPGPGRPVRPGAAGNQLAVRPASARRPHPRVVLASTCITITQRGRLTSRRLQDDDGTFFFWEDPAL